MIALDTRNADLVRAGRNERVGVILFGLGLVAGFLANITWPSTAAVDARPGERAGTSYV